MPHNQIIATVQFEVLKLHWVLQVSNINCSVPVSEASSVVTGQMVTAIYILLKCRKT